VATILTPTEQDKRLKTTIQLALDNFSLASLIASVLREYAAAKLPPPKATVVLRGAGRGVDIPGENCGFFTTPVIQMAILDCRRTLEFFGLTCDSKVGCLKAIAFRRPDDFGIEHFGLAWVSPHQFVQTAGPVVATSIEPLLLDVHRWSNKQLAHFTITEPPVTFDAIRDVSTVMIEAYLRLLFDALGRPRPRIQPTIKS
jgi:hypothetical protein